MKTRTFLNLLVVFALVMLQASWSMPAQARANAGTPLVPQVASSPASTSPSQSGYLADLSTLYVTGYGTGSGTITSNPADINCGSICSYAFSTGTVVELTAVPDPGVQFAWGYPCSGSGTCQVTVTGNTYISGEFYVNQQLLTVSKAGTGTGTVTQISSAPAISCGATCSAYFDYQSSVNLSATADPGSTFTGWSGEAGLYCPATGNCWVYMYADRSVTANFNHNSTLTIQQTGTGFGTVISSPPGISCGSACSAAFADGTELTLSAVPLTLSDSFMGWSGDIGTSTTNPLIFYMNGDMSIGSRFDRAFLGNLIYLPLLKK